MTDTPTTMTDTPSANNDSVPTVPSDPFKPYQQRVVQEHAELTDRLEKLTAYLSPLDESKPMPHEVRALFRQRAVMQEYAAILADRIHNFR